MRKIIVAVVLLVCLSGLALFAKDIYATTTDGKTVVLHDNGKWEYATTTTTKTSGSSDGTIYGTWCFPEGYFSTLVDLAMESAGITADSPYASMYRPMIESALIEQTGVTSGDMNEVLAAIMTLTIDKDTITVVSGGIVSQTKYTVDSATRTIYIIDPESNQKTALGTFDKDYSTLTLDGETPGVLVKK